MSLALGHAAKIYSFIFDSVNLVSTKLSRIIDNHALALASRL